MHGEQSRPQWEARLDRDPLAKQGHGGSSSRPWAEGPSCDRAVPTKDSWRQNGGNNRKSIHLSVKMFADTRVDKALHRRWIVKCCTISGIISRRFEKRCTLWRGTSAKGSREARKFGESSKFQEHAVVFSKVLKAGCVLIRDVCRAFGEFWTVFADVTVSASSLSPPAFPLFVRLPPLPDTQRLGRQPENDHRSEAHSRGLKNDSKTKALTIPTTQPT